MNRSQCNDDGDGNSQSMARGRIENTYVIKSSIYDDRGVRRGRVRIEKISGGNSLRPVVAPRNLSANSGDRMMLMMV